MTFVQDGVTYLLRDKFSSAQSPLVDGNASEGAGEGYRDVFGSGFYAAASRCRGGNTSEGKIVYKPDSGTSGWARSGGRTFCALMTPDDGDGDMSLWLAETAGTLNGYGIQFNDKTIDIIEPDGNIVRALVVDGNPGRATSYLVGITLNEGRGAVYWVSALADYTPTNEWPVYGYPNARILFISTLGTFSTVHPTIRANSGFSYPGGVAFEDVRLLDVADWAGEDGMALFADRFDRADSSTTLGAAWSVGASSVWGVSSNQAYCSTAQFQGRAVVNAGQADVFVVAQITSGSVLSDWFGLCLRQASSSSNTFMRLHNNGTANIYLQKFVDNGYDNEVFGTFASFSTAQTKRWLAGCFGDEFRIWLNGDETVIQPNLDTDSHHTEGTYFGLFGDSASGQRWDYFAIYPISIALPDEFDSGAYPVLFTTYDTLATDTFTDANGTALAAHDAAWATDDGTWTVESNRAQGAGSSGQLVVYQDVGQAAVQASVEVVMPGSVTSVRAGLCLRRVDVNNAVYIRTFVDDATQLNNDEIEVEEVIGGVVTVVKKCYLGNCFANSTSYTLFAQVSGDVLHVLLDDVHELTVFLSNAALLTGEGAGLYREGGGNNVVFDDFSVVSLTNPVVPPLPSTGYPAPGITRWGDPVVY